MSESNPLELFYKLPSAVQLAEDADAVATLMASVLRTNTNALAVSQRAIDAQSISTISSDVVLPWVNLRIRLSELIDAGNVLYGDPQVYGGGLLYGQLQANRFRVPIPSEWNDIGFIADGVEAPSKVLDRSKFSIDTIAGVKYLNFISDPFTTFTGYPVTSSTGIGDSEVSIWLHDLGFNDKAVYYRFGNDVGLGFVNNPNYLEGTKLIREALQLGVSSTLLQRVLSAGAGVELAVGSEVVETIATTSAGLHVVTSKRAYNFAAGSTAIVTVGQELEQYNAIVDTVRVYDFSERQTLFPAIPAIIVNTKVGRLAFPNIVTTWSYTVTGGLPDARFPVYGDSTVVEAFWAATRAAGALATPLATLVGVSASGVVSVNPAEFVVSNLLQPGLVIAVVRPELFRNPLPQLFARISTLLPSNALIITHQDILGVPLESYDLTTEASSGEVYTCVHNPSDTISVSGYDLSLSDLTPTVSAL